MLCLQVKSSDEAVILCKTAIGALKLNIGDLQVTKVRDYSCTSFSTF